MSLAKNDGTIVTADVEHANTFLKQVIGLMFRKYFEGALVFDLGRERFEGIHMLFVRIPIDVIFLDSGRKIVEVKTNLRPWFGAALPRSRFRYAIELPAGTIEKFGLENGQCISW
jgi:uncharacterized membrane protein (UPF0127 family)